MRCKRMAEGMTGGGLRHAGQAHRILERLLHEALVEMMPASGAATRVVVETGCGKDPLPRPFKSGARVLAVEGVRQLDAAETGSAIALVLETDTREVASER